MIPRKFVEKYGKVLSNTIYLKTPNGAKWKLNLVNSDGKIFFEKGWKEFAEYHSLAHGHLVLFRYEKTSLFEVHIFDKSALEINYPFQRVAAKMVSNGQKRKANSSFKFHQPCEIGSNSCVEVEKLQKVATLYHAGRESRGIQFCVFIVS
jgi:hypothetical protein